jgi:low affinity Fe/Cu permease
MSFIAIILLWGLFKLNLFSTGWNVVVELIITAILFILTGFNGNEWPARISAHQ